MDRVLCADFETTVFKGQKYTEVWASSLVELYTENVIVDNSIDGFFQTLYKLYRCNCIIYFHNLKFDGTFIVTWLINNNYITAIEDGVWLSDKKMQNHTFKYMISDKGQWYSITVKYRGKYYTFRDSLKLLPFKLSKIGKDFDTKHKKLSMEYNGKRYAGWNITTQEYEYIVNDALVLKEAMEIMYSNGYDKTTIGACCMNEYKKTWDKEQYEALFPDMVQIPCPINGFANAYEYVLKSYHGGWCYVVEGKENKIYKNGITVDANSLYPSQMSGESLNRYPVGMPFWFEGEIPEDVLYNKKWYYFVRIQCRFKLKAGYLPFIQVKGDLRYKGTKMLKTSAPDYLDNDLDNSSESTVILTLTETDYCRFKEYYAVFDEQILDGCYFNTACGIFDDYIEYYKKIKMTSTGSKRTLAKLFLNNLYGKFATSDNSSFKECYLKDGVLQYINHIEHEKKTQYIPIGSAITSYSRDCTIRKATLNYYGLSKNGFIYADTDSLHCDLQESDLIDIEMHDTEFLKWSVECCWNEAIFCRQKTYVEIERDNVNVTCAGMHENAKKCFIRNYKNGSLKLTDFKAGLKVWGNLKPKRIIGGTVLEDDYYTMR